MSKSVWTQIHFTFFLTVALVSPTLTRAADEPQTRTVRSNDGQVELTIPASMNDRPAVDVTTLSVYDFHTHRAVTCTVHRPKLNDRIRTLADFAHKTTENSDLSGPRLGPAHNVKLENGIFAMQSERRIPDPRENKYEIVTMIAVTRGFVAVSVLFPEQDGKVDRAAMDKIINSIRLPQGGGQEASLPTTGPTTNRVMKVWTTRNNAARVLLPENFEESKNPNAPVADGFVALDEEQRLGVSMISRFRSAGANLDDLTEGTRRDLLKSNFAAKATKPAPIKVNGNRAIRFECAANVRGEDMLSVATIVETPRTISVILVLGPTELIRSQGDFVDAVLASLEEVPPGTAPPQQPPQPRNP
jgi:hypothetical protein